MVRALCDKCSAIQDFKNLVCIEINIDAYGIEGLKLYYRASCVKLYYCASCVKKFKEELIC